MHLFSYTRSEVVFRTNRAVFVLKARLVLNAVADGRGGAAAGLVHGDHPLVGPRSPRGLLSLSRSLPLPGAVEHDRGQPLPHNASAAPPAYSRSASASSSTDSGWSESMDDGEGRTGGGEDAASSCMPDAGSSDMECTPVDDDFVSIARCDPPLSLDPVANDPPLSLHPVATLPALSNPLQNLHPKP